MQEFPVGHTGGGEGHVLAADQVVDRISATQVLESRGAGSLLVFARAQPEPALEVSPQALERAGGEHRLGQPAHPHHHVDPGAFERGHDGGGDVAVAEQTDPGAGLAHLFHQGFVPGPIQHNHREIGELQVLGEGDALEVVLDRIRDVDGAACLGADGDFLRVQPQWSADQ